MTNPGLHVAAIDYCEYPGAGSHLRLAVAGLRLAITCLEDSGEAGCRNAILLLEQHIDALQGPPIRDLLDPEDTAPSGVPKLFGGEARVMTLPYRMREP